MSDVISVLPTAAAAPATVLHAPQAQTAHLADDTWTWLAEEAATELLQGPQPSVVSVAQWLANADDWQRQGRRRGVRLAAGEIPEALAGRLEGLSLIAVEFAAFADGRGFSVARYLRQRLHWEGELRAVGDVLVDTVNYLARCGFDSFQLKPGHDPRDALRQLRWFPQPYQRGYRPLATTEAA